jgi:hypothetical protein
VPKLIFLTGFSGSGKTCATKKFRDQVFRIDGDHLFSTSLRTLRPELDPSLKNVWPSWPRDDRGAATVARVFSQSLEKAEPDIRQHRGHVIADGAIFVYDWFRNPLLGALATVGHRFSDGDVHHLYIALTDQQLFDNIHKRARPNEVRDFKDVETVAQRNASFQSHFGPSRSIWTEATTFGDLVASLGAILRG